MSTKVAVYSARLAVSAKVLQTGREIHKYVLLIVATVAWAATSIFLGLVVGIAAVALPPTGAFGIVAVAGLVLLWVLPDLPVAPARMVRRAFLLFLVVDLCVPFYYAIDLPGLPWISARRVAAFALIAPFMLGMSASSAVRRRVLERARHARPIVICAIGFLATIFLSLLTSVNPAGSLSQMTDAILEWYVPFFAAIYVIEDQEDILFLLKIVCVSAILIALGGIIEFRMERNIFLGMLPKSFLDDFLANNPTFARGLEAIYRNGIYRASSIFAVSNSFGEFEAIVVPIGLFFAAYGRTVYSKGLGCAAVVAAMAGIVVSGARCGYIAFLPTTALFAVIWAFRKARENKASLAPAFVMVAGGMGFLLTIAAILFWPRARVLVLGDGYAAYSTQSRFDQWHLGWPLILSNPVTGHGYSMAGDLLGWNGGGTVDSYPLSLLIECGVPALVFFAGFVLLPIAYGLRATWVDRSEKGALSGALACSFIAYLICRLVLSVRENHMLFFMLVATIIMMKYFESPTTVAAAAKPVFGGRASGRHVRESPDLVRNSGQR